MPHIQYAKMTIFLRKQTGEFYSKWYLVSTPTVSIWTRR